MTWIKGFLFLLFIPIIAGCHGAEDAEEDRRKRRQLGSNQVQEVEDTTYLRDFFVECLRNEVGDIWTWESVIDITILDLQWFQNSAGSNCREGSMEDSATCWRNRLNQLLNGTSELLEPSRQCINRYTVNTTIARLRAGRFKRQLEPQSGEECSDYYPNSPATRMFTSCNEQTIILPQNRREVDFATVNQFVAENLICSSELEDCSGSQQETISNDDPSVPNWPYLFQAVTRRDSPVRQSVVVCNGRFFPLPSNQALQQECSAWGRWTTCVCGRDEARTRTRTCPPGFSGNTREDERCSERNCVSSFASMLQQIFSISIVRNFANLPLGFRVGY